MVNTDEIVQRVVKRLEETLIQPLQGEIKKMIQDAVATEFKALNQRLARLERTMDAWKEDLDFDRENMSDIRVKGGNTVTEIQEVRKTLSELPKKVEETVNKTVSETIAEAVPQAVSDTFEVTAKDPKKQVKVEKKPRKKFLGIF